jgi:hypothetical protein
LRNTNDDVPRRRDAVERDISSADLMPLASAAQVIEEKVYAYDPRSIPERAAGIAYALAGRMAEVIAMLRSRQRSEMARSSDQRLR